MEKNKDIKKIIKDMKNEPELMSTINVEELLKKVNDKSTDFLENKTIEMIHQETMEIIRSMNISEERTQEIYDKLLEYRFVKNTEELHKGKLIKTISRNINNESSFNPKLHMRGKVIEIKYYETCTHILCINIPKHFTQYNFDNFYTFQKLSVEEQMILSLYKHIREGDNINTNNET